MTLILSGGLSVSAGQRLSCDPLVSAVSTGLPPILYTGRFMMTAV